MADENTQNNGQTTDAENGSQGGQTSNDQNAGGQQQQPQYVTVDQLNRALTGYNKRFEKQLQDTLSSSLTPIQELFKQLQNPDGGNAGDGNDSSNAQNQQQQQAQPNKELLKMQKQLEELNKRLQASDQEKESAVKQALEEKVKSQVLSTLTNLKVEKGEQVFRLIRDNIVIGEDGSVKIRVVDPTLGFEDEKDLKSGLTDWLNSDGIHFLPPRNVSGSGATNRAGGTGGQKIVNPGDLMKMKPSELAKVDLRQVLGEDTLSAFFNTNQ